MSFSWITQSGPIALSVLVILLAFSVVSWGIIFVKLRTLKSIEKSSGEFSELFWKLRRFDEVYESSKRFPNSPIARVFQQGYQELAAVKAEEKTSGGLMGASGVESVEHALRRACSSEMSEVEKLVPFLATVGSTSPFIGLFGTVVGIINAFQQIGAKGSANLAVVAPGIAEALVATAAGLLAAIPAVMAYNYFSVRLRTISLNMNNFSSDMLSIVRRHLI